MWKKSDFLGKVKRVMNQDPFMLQETMTVLTQVNYREVRLDEIKTLQAIQKAVYPDRSNWSRYAFLAELNGQNPVNYLAADCKGRIIGFGGIRIENEKYKAHLTNLAVLPAAQGQGVGSELLARLLAFASTHQVSMISLEVRASNTKAQRLYQSLGFNIVKTQSAYYRDGEDAYVMVLKLKAEGEQDG